MWSLRMRTFYTEILLVTAFRKTPQQKGHGIWFRDAISEVTFNAAIERSLPVAVQYLWLRSFMFFGNSANIFSNIVIWVIRA
jgi:hypothetical protein